MKAMKDYEPPLRVVSVRDLSRSTREVIERIQETGVGCLVVRWGRPVATIQPIRTTVAISMTEASTGPIPMGRSELAALDLDEVEIEVLVALTHPMSWQRIAEESGIEISKLGLPLLRLSTKQLLLEDWGVYKLTSHGARARAGLADLEEHDGEKHNLHPKVTGGKRLRNTDETTRQEPDSNL